MNQPWRCAWHSFRETMGPAAPMIASRYALLHWWPSPWRAVQEAA